MTDEPPPSPPARRGRPPVLLERARAVFARTDLADCRFVLGPWLESLSPAMLAQLARDTERFANERLEQRAAGDLALIVFKILERELPKAKGFHENLLADAFRRLYGHAELEKYRREGVLLIKGERALSSENGIELVHLDEPPQEPMAARPETTMADDATTDPA